MVWAAGQKLYGDRYTIERKLGQGGFGITYLAKDRRSKPVVIKTLKDEVMTSPEFADFREKYQRDFRDEATRLAVCRHSHIVQIENVFHHESFPCIAMEYIDGEDLWRRVKNGGVLPQAEAVRYIQQIGEALTVVHDKGLLHRDLKPNNIMVRQGKSEAVLIDFGIAREFIPNLTQTHSVHVTPGFAPIEQYDEQAHRGEFTDVYALAATLYFLLTGKVPPPAFMRIIRDSLMSPQQVNQTISDVVNQGILTGMAIQPENRPQSVPEWLQLLDLAVKSEKPFPNPSLHKRLPLPPPPIPSFFLGETERGEEEARFNSPASGGLREVADDLSSEWEIDYSKLRDLLAAGDWKEADQETANQMLAVIGKQDWWQVSREDIENFACKDLGTIDSLWVKYSNGRFGFSVQKRIWMSIGGKLGESDYDIYKKFSARVGWYVKEKDRWNQNLTFTLKAAVGHLPAFGLMVEEGQGLMGKLIKNASAGSAAQTCLWRVSSLASRLVKCNI